MAETTLRFNNVKTVINNKNPKGVTSYQTKKFPTAYILYTTLAELPEALADNALIFTTDTAELFVGTGSGIQRLKLGTEADLNPRLYLKILEAKEIYKNKLEAEQDKTELQNLIQELKDSVYSKADIDNFITNDIDLDGVIDKLNLYTIEKVNQLLEQEASRADVYTQTQVNEKVDEAKQEASDAVAALKTEVAETYATVADAATKTELSDKEIEIKDFVADKYLNKEDAVAVYSTIEEVNNLKNSVYTSAYIDEKLAEVNEGINNNLTEINNIKASYVKQDTYDADKASLDNSIESLNSNLNTLDNDTYKKVDIDEKVSTINTELENLDSKKVNVETYNSEKSVLQNDIVTLDGNIRVLADAVYSKEAVDEKETALNSRINGLSQSVTAVNNKIDNNVTELNTAIQAAQAVADDAAPQAYVDQELDKKANSQDVYRKTEADTNINNKVNTAYDTISESIEAGLINQVTTTGLTSAQKVAAYIKAINNQKADKSEVINVDNKVDTLANKVTALENKDVYTKAEVDAAIETAIKNVISQIQEAINA